jgi:hypothetical protein
MVVWEYLIVALPAFKAPTHAPGISASVAALNGEGDQGWEAVGMTSLADGTVAVLMKSRDMKTVVQRSEPAVVTTALR